MPPRPLLALIAMWLAGCNGAPSVDRPTLAHILELQDRRIAAIDELSAHLRSPSVWARRFATRALGAIGNPAAAVALAQTLARDSDADTRREAAAALGRCHPNHPALLAVLVDRDEQVRALAVRVIADTCVLARSLHDPAASVRAAAGWRLEQLGSGAGDHLGTLLTAWQTETEPLAQLGLLSALAARPRPALASLFAAVIGSRDAPLDQLVAGLAALEAGVGSDDATRRRLRASPAAEATRRLLLHPHPAVAAASAQTLAALAAPHDLHVAASDLTTLRLALAEPRRGDQIVAIARAVAAQANTPRQHEVWCDALLVGLNRGDGASRAAHLRALAELDATRALDQVNRLRETPQPWLRIAAAEVAGRLNVDREARTSPIFHSNPPTLAAHLRGLATGAHPPRWLASLHAAEPTLFDLIPDLLHEATRQLDPAGHLLAIARQPDYDDLTRALATRAAWLASSEDDAAASFAELRHAAPMVAAALPGPVGPWPSTDTPAPQTQFWSLLGRTLHLELRTTRGKVSLALDPSAAPVHVHSLLGDLESGQPWPRAVLRSTAERVQFGNPLAARPHAPAGAPAGAQTAQQVSRQDWSVWCPCHSLIWTARSCSSRASAPQTGWLAARSSGVSSTAWALSNRWKTVTESSTSAGTSSRTEIASNRRNPLRIHELFWLHEPRRRRRSRARQAWGRGL